MSLALAAPELAGAASPPTSARRRLPDPANRPGRGWVPADATGRRQAAMVMALLVSALLPLPFLIPQSQDPAASAPGAERVTLLRLLPLAPTTDDAPPPLTTATPAAATSGAVQRAGEARPAPRPAVGHAITLPMAPGITRPGVGPTVDAPSTAPDIGGDPAPSPQAASPAPSSAPSASQAPVLRLDDTVMRIAAREALHPLRSGDGPRLIEPEAFSAADRLGKEVADAAKPDCIQPGDSLLALPLVLLAVITDRCR